MNDPHVEALIYVVEHDSTVTYGDATPVEVDRPEFLVTIEEGHARFELKEHYATSAEARDGVQPFIDQWEFEASLETGPGQFALLFDEAEIVDRNPTPGTVSVSARPTAWRIRGSIPAVTVSRQYPRLPSEVAMGIRDPDVETMHYRFTRYRKGYEELSSVAYFCLTMLEYKFKGNRRNKAAEHFRTDRNVLNNIGRLTGDKAGKGGRDARKAIDYVGIPDDYAADEKQFLEEAIKLLIIQAARVAANSDADIPHVTMADLPPLCG